MELWRLRIKVFVERFWQPTSACMACMPGSLANLWSVAHWQTALQTGLATGLLALFLSLTPAVRFYRNRFQNAVVVGCLTAFGDAFAHRSHYGGAYVEAIVTGLVSGSLSLVASYLLEDRARRLRAAWTRLSS